MAFRFPTREPYQLHPSHVVTLKAAPGATLYRCPSCGGSGNAPAMGGFFSFQQRVISCLTCRNWGYIGSKQMATYEAWKDNTTAARAADER